MALFVAAGAREAVRRADDDHVTGDERGGVEPDVGGVEVELLVVVQLEVDHAVRAEGGDRHAGLRVERDHPVAGRDVDDPLDRDPSALDQ